MYKGSHPGPEHGAGPSSRVLASKRLNPLMLPLIMTFLS